MNLLGDPSSASLSGDNKHGSKIRQLPRLKFWLPQCAVFPSRTRVDVPEVPQHRSDAVGAAPAPLGKAVELCLGTADVPSVGPPALLPSFFLGILRYLYGNIHPLLSGSVFKIVSTAWSGKCRVPLSSCPAQPGSIRSLGSQLPHPSSGESRIANGSGMPSPGEYVWSGLV